MFTQKKLSKKKSSSKKPQSRWSQDLDLFKKKITDLEEEVAARKRLELTLRHMRGVVESSDDAIISKDLDGIITSWNVGAERIFGYLESEIIGKPVTMLIPDDHANEEPDILHRIRSGKRIEHYETVRKRKDGRLINVSLTVSPIKDETGKVIGASKIARDVTERVRAQKELEEVLRRERIATRIKDEFIAMLSHELRAPLNPVLLLASDGAKNQDFPEVIRRQFETILTNIKLEARLIDDLLDLSRITHGKLLLEKRVVKATDVIENTLKLIRPESDAKRIQIKVSLEAREEVIEVDPTRLQQVFWNILSNAVKFTPGGGTIKVSSVRSGEKIRFLITDNGMGMAPAELKKIFAAFGQGDHVSGSQRHGGLGLGLAIARRLIELHGGTVEASSPGLNLGSTFMIELPLSTQPGAETAHARDRAIQTRSKNHEAARARILLIDDHTPTRDALAYLLTRRGFTILKASSSSEARSLAQTEKVDFVISDIGLPDGDGNELMAELRDRHSLRGIALSGYGMENDIALSRTAGFVTHLLKPVDVNALDQAIALLV